MRQIDPIEDLVVIHTGIASQELGKMRLLARYARLLGWVERLGRQRWNAAGEHGLE